MAQIIIRQLHVEAAVGLLDWERVQTQKLELTCALQIDASRAAESDSITDTVDYAQLRSCIQSFCASNRFYLLEALAENLANYLLGVFSIVESLRLTILKPVIFSDANGVGIEIEKTRLRKGLL
jgi:dihydroneopterin aldolase